MPLHLTTADPDFESAFAVFLAAMLAIRPFGRMLGMVAAGLVGSAAGFAMVGYAGGGNKFDLSRWNEDYFKRLRDFVSHASKRGVVVEMSVFCPFYEDSMWNLSPMNAANNINGVGITSIVGMTSMIRGFDQSLRDMIGAIGPNTIFIQRFNVASFANGAELRDLFKRPNLTISDARAIEEQTEAIRLVDVELGAGGPPTQRRVFYRDQKTKQVLVLGTGERFAEGSLLPFIAGRYFNGIEVQYRKNVVVLAISVVSMPMLVDSDVAAPRAALDPAESEVGPRRSRS
jgi:hypothetical protein